MLMVTIMNRTWPQTEKKISLQELAKHSTANDCWIEINGKIYDVTEYLGKHKSAHDYDYTKWCGKGASKAWADKDGQSRGHNRKAHLILKRYLIGEI